MCVPHTLTPFISSPTSAVPVSHELHVLPDKRTILRRWCASVAADACSLLLTPSLARCSPASPSPINLAPQERCRPQARLSHTIRLDPPCEACLHSRHYQIPESTLWPALRHSTAHFHGILCPRPSGEHPPEEASRAFAGPRNSLLVTPCYRLPLCIIPPHCAPLEALRPTSLRGKV
jgi:hypothetical protein